MAKDTYETHDELETPRDGLGNALIVVTFVILLAAVILAQKALGSKYNAGMFADKSAPAK